MIEAGRIPMASDEHEAVERLLAKHGSSATLTRRDPGESGPLLLHVDAVTYEIDGAKVRKLRTPRTR